MSRRCPFHKIEIPEKTQECPFCASIDRGAQGEQYILKSRIKDLIEELDNTITVRTPTEYDAGYNSGLQAAITSLEALL